MNEQEKNFVEAFVVSDSRQRCLTLLASKKGRAKIRLALAHTFTSYLDERYIYPLDSLPIEVSRKSQAVLKKAGWTPLSLCYVISDRSEADGREMTLSQAEEYHAHWYGIIIVLVPGQVAYYRTEGRDPDYLLFREAL